MVGWLVGVWECVSEFSATTTTTATATATATGLEAPPAIKYVGSERRKEVRRMVRRINSQKNSEKNSKKIQQQSSRLTPLLLHCTVRMI